METIDNKIRHKNHDKPRICTEKDLGEEINSLGHLHFCPLKSGFYMNSHLLSANFAAFKF